MPPYFLGVNQKLAEPKELKAGGGRGIRTLDTALTVYTISSRAPSTTRPPLQRKHTVEDNGGCFKKQGCFTLLV